MKLLTTKLNLLIESYFSDRPDILKIWNFIKSHPDFSSEILNDIDRTIMLFNKYKNDNLTQEENLQVPSSSYLKKILQDDLPSVNKIIKLVENQDKKTIQVIVADVKGFKFIETLRPIENCAGTLLLGCYRCAMRALFPYIKEKNGQVASSLEEMAAIMALKGEKTKLFETVKSWFSDYEEEGFSKELSDAVKNL